MPEENPCALEKLAHISRYALVALFAMALASGWLSGTGQDRVSAATPIGAAPNFLSFTVKTAGNSKFYLTDTNLRTIAVYSLEKESVKLVGVRKFDADSQIVDSSIKTARGTLEAVSGGATREDAVNYAKHCQPILEAATAKFGSDLGPKGGDQ
jgi:hypothetical protein